MADVRDQAGLDAVRAQLEREGNDDVDQIPAQFSPQLPQAWRAKAVTVLQEAEQEMKNRQLALTARGQDITIRGQNITVRGQDMTDARARETSAAGGRPPNGYRWAPDGNLQPIPGGPADRGRAGVKLTEDQGKNTGYLAMAGQALSVLNQYKDWTPGEAARAAFGTPVLERAVPDRDRRILSAQMAFTEAALRAATGAAYTKEEIRQNIGVYFPTPGDDAATKADKAAQREQALAGMRTRSGPGASTVRTIAPTPRRDKPAASGPKPGTVQDGYRFKGGDPANPRSWVKVS
jgi:hypothetical protein